MVRSNVALIRLRLVDVRKSWKQRILKLQQKPRLACWEVSFVNTGSVDGECGTSGPSGGRYPDVSVARDDALIATETKAGRCRGQMGAKYIHMRAFVGSDVGQINHHFQITPVIRVAVKGLRRALAGHLWKGPMQADR